MNTRLVGTLVILMLFCPLVALDIAEAYDFADVYFTYDFEGGATFGEYWSDSTGSVWLDSEIYPYQGSYCMRADPTASGGDAHINVDINDTVTSMHLQVAHRINSTVLSYNYGTKICRFIGTTGSSNMRIDIYWATVYPTDRFCIRNYLGVTEFNYTETPVLDDEWHTYDINVNLDGAGYMNVTVDIDDGAGYVELINDYKAGFVDIIGLEVGLTGGTLLGGEYYHYDSIQVGDPPPPPANMIWTFIGLVGLVMMFAGVLIPTWKASKDGWLNEETIKFFAYGALSFLIGMGLVITWIYGGFSP